MIPLHTIQIAAPCHADWDEMQGDARVRFCRTCRKNVYNLSEMTQDEAQALVSRLEGRLCVRFYTRADGTLLTRDCPVGLRAVRRKLVKKLSYAAAVLLSCASGQMWGTGAAPAATPAKKRVVKPHAVQPSHEMGRIAWPSHTMGMVALPPPPTMGTSLPPKR